MEYTMSDTPTKPLVRTDDKPPAPAAFGWPSVDALRREIDHLFDDFGRGVWLRPFQSAALDPIFRRGFSFNAPAVDVLEKDTAFELTAEIPGIEARDVDVSVKDGNLVIKGEKKSTKEEKSKDYHLQERQYGAFERRLAMPKGVDPSAVEARFNNGVLTVTMPKTIEAQKPAKKIEVKSA
jgi:HSP20 family protein